MKHTLLIVCQPASAYQVCADGVVVGVIQNGVFQKPPCLHTLVAMGEEIAAKLFDTVLRIQPNPNSSPQNLSFMAMNDGSAFCGGYPAKVSLAAPRDLGGVMEITLQALRAEIARRNVLTKMACNEIHITDVERDLIINNLSVLLQQCDVSYQPRIALSLATTLNGLYLKLAGNENSVFLANKDQLT